MAVAVFFVSAVRIVSLKGATCMLESHLFFVLQPEANGAGQYRDSILLWTPLATLHLLGWLDK